MAAQPSGSFILTTSQQPPFQISLFGFHNRVASFAEEETVLTNQKENIISLLAGQNFYLRNSLFLLHGYIVYIEDFFQHIFKMFASNSLDVLCQHPSM